jgi:hypothetical protein
MEDKWFIYYEEPRLFVHRSWTGYCIFEVRFEPTAGGILIAEVRANRNPAQCTETDDVRDATLLKILLGSRAKQEMGSQMIEFIRQRSLKP